MTKNLILSQSYSTPTPFILSNILLSLSIPITHKKAKPAATPERTSLLNFPKRSMNFAKQRVGTLLELSNKIIIIIIIVISKERTTIITLNLVV